MQGSILDSVGDDASTLAASSDGLTEASPQLGIQAVDQSEIQPDGSGDSSDSPGDSDNSAKRIEDAQRKMHQEAEARARLEGKLAAMEEQFKALAQQKLDAAQGQQADPLFAFADDDEFASRFEADPGAATQEMLQAMAKDLRRFSDEQKALIQSSVRSVDPVEQRIEEMSETLSAQPWFRDLSPADRRGAALAYINSPSNNGGTNGNGSTQPRPHGTGTGTGKRVVKQKQDIPMEKDPQYMPILRQMGGLQDQRGSFTLNDAPLTAD